MATEVLIPKLGMTMTEGTVAEWRIPDGGEVQPGEIVYKLETEKIEFEVEAEAPGIVRHLVPAGTTLEPGVVVAYILAPGEAMPAATAPAAISAPAAAVPAASQPAVTVLEGGRVTVCTQCAARRGIGPEHVLPGIRIAGAAVFVEESLAERAQALVY